jgi:hypothetical protein
VGEMTAILPSCHPRSALPRISQWDSPSPLSVALERGHNVLLSGLMVATVDSLWDGIKGRGWLRVARYNGPQAYCH